MTMGLALAIIGAAAAALLGGMGSAWGVSLAAEAAGGVLTEDPDKFGRLLIMVALPGTQGFYGFLGGFYIMMKINLLGGGIPLDLPTGLALFFASLPIAIVGFISAYFQGRASVAGVHIIAKRPEEMGKSIILPAMVETYAVLALLATILIVTGIKV